MSLSRGVSKRTLQRHLKDEGTSFQQILNRTREDLARHYLVDSDLPAADLSFLFGYEDPSSFDRALHDWTGETPQRVRSGAA